MDVREAASRSKSNKTCIDENAAGSKPGISKRALQYMSSVMLPINDKISTTNYFLYTGVTSSTINYINIYENYEDPKREKPLPSLSVDLNASPEQDCISIYDILKKGSNFSNICRILCRRSAAQREIIKSTYQNMYSTDIIMIFNTLPEKQDYWVGCSLLYTGADLDAFYIQASLSNKSWMYCVLREIICTRSSIQLNLIIESYQKLYNLPLEDVIKSKTEEPMKSLFLALIEENRPDTTDFDADLAYSDISILLDDNIYKSHPDKPIEIFTKRSYVQLRKTFELFINTYGYSIIKLYIGLSKGIFKKTIKTIVIHIQNSYEYFADVLLTYILKESVLDILRLVISRSEIDLCSVVRYYQDRQCRGWQDLRKDLKGLFFFRNSLYLEIFTVFLGLK